MKMARAIYNQNKDESTKPRLFAFSLGYPGKILNCQIILKSVFPLFKLDVIAFRDMKKSDGEEVLKEAVNFVECPFLVHPLNNVK